MRQKFTVEGMSCVNCSAAVEAAVRILDGVESVEVSLLGKSMICDFDENKITSKKIMQTVNKAGYRAFAYGEKDVEKSAYLSVKTRLISSFVILIPLMYISMGEMFGFPMLRIFEKYPLASAATQLLLALAVAIINSKFFVSGFRALFKMHPNMDSLVALGSCASFLYGIFASVMIAVGMFGKDPATVAKYSHGLYFDSAAMILTLVTVGKALEERAKTKTGSAIAKLSRLSPEISTVIRDGNEIDIPSSEIVLGDTVLVRPGVSIPVDGIVIEGSSEINEAALTGESLPRFKTVGDEVMTASVNLTGAFKMRALRVGNDTMLSKIIEIVENTGASKAPVARLADKVAAVFIPIVATVSVLTLLVWTLCRMPFDFALARAISVLVISCPCALGLATPVAITVAVGKCASEGILVKSAEALETLHRTDVVVFDKTGTLTKGHPSVTDLVILNGERDRLLSVALTLEKNSEHPLAKAICSYAEENGAALLDSSDFSAIPGRGVRARVEGISCFAGNAAYMSELEIDVSAHVRELEILSENGKTVMFFAVDDKLVGIMAASDGIADGASEALRLLSELGTDTVMLTGDNSLSAKATAERLGISSVISDVLPDEKGKAVSDLKKDGRTVVMVGDGINDAPALSTADVGIAIGAGSDIAIDSADIVLIKNDISDVARALKYSRSVLVNIKENLFWAFFYNAVCIPIAAGVLYPAFGITLSPMLASAAMSFSSMFVVLNALRLYRK